MASFPVASESNAIEDALRGQRKADFRPVREIYDIQLAEWKKGCKRTGEGELARRRMLGALIVKEIRASLLLNKHLSRFIS